MTDLEIRADEYIVNNPENGMNLMARDIDETHVDYTFLDMKGAYIKGSIEQNAIDIEKAIEWIRLHAYELATRDMTDYIRDFRKSMEL